MPAVTKLGMVGVLGFTLLIAFINMIISAVLVASYNRSEYPTTTFKNVTRFTLFVSIFNLVFGGAYIFFILKLGTSIIASIISFLGFLFILWIFWLASGASTATAYGGRFSCSNDSFAHCNQILAMEAFSFINFIVIFVAFCGVAFLGFRATRKGSGITAPVAA